MEIRGIAHLINKPFPFSSLFYNDNGTLRKTVLYAQLAKTLETIAKQGPGAFYNGNIAQDLIKDIMNASDHQDSGILFLPATC